MEIKKAASGRSKKELNLGQPSSLKVRTPVLNSRSSFKTGSSTAAGWDFARLTSMLTRARWTSWVPSSAAEILPASRVLALPSSSKQEVASLARSWGRTGSQVLAGTTERPWSTRAAEMQLLPVILEATRKTKKYLRLIKLSQEREVRCWFYVRLCALKQELTSSMHPPYKSFEGSCNAWAYKCSAAFKKSQMTLLILKQSSGAPTPN